MKSKYKSSFKDLGEMLYGTVIGTAKIGGEFIRAALTGPELVFFAPTLLNKLKKLYNKLSPEEKEKVKNPAVYISTIRDDIAGTFGALTTGILIGTNFDDIYHFLRDNPKYLAIPIVTNILSAGYERFKKDKEKKLEQRVE